jgi:hypothetical protein
MPIYEYRCADGHKTDHVHRVSDGDRPDTIDCPVPRCGLPAWYKFAAANIGGPEGKRKLYAEEGLIVRVVGVTHDIRCAELRCSACEHDYFDALLPTDALPPCPKCGAQPKEKPGCPTAEGMKRFPYHDRGLGCIVNSPAHRAAICKERGLVPVDGDWDADDYLRKRHEADAAHDAEYAAYEDRLNNSPEFATLREAQDRGAF